MKTVKSLRTSINIANIYILTYILFIWITRNNIGINTMIRRSFTFIALMLACIFMYGGQKKNDGWIKSFWLIVLKATILYAVGIFFQGINASFSYLDPDISKLMISNYIYGASLILYFIAFVIFVRNYKLKIYISQLFIDNLIAFTVIVTIWWVYVVDHIDISIVLKQKILLPPLMFTGIQMAGIYTLINILTIEEAVINKGSIYGIISFVVHTITNFIYVYANMTGYNLPIIIDVIWGLSIMSIGISSLSEQKLDLRTKKFRRFKATFNFWSLIMPYLSILTIIVVAILNWPDNLSIITSGGIVIVLLSIRQFMNRIEKNNLINDLSILNNQLEEKVAQRTKEIEVKSNKLEHIAHHDSLTGLPNRRYLLNEVDNILLESKEQGNLISVLFIDLDNFKDINDIFGHPIGDKLLVEVSNRFTKLLSDKNKYQIFRNGGDEFTIIFKNISDMKSVEQKIKEIQEKVSQAIFIDNIKINLTMSIGVALYPIHGINKDDLLKAADIAMYEAKNRGKKKFCIYNSIMNSNIKKKIEIQNDLQKAIEEEQFSLYYQPQYDLEAENIVAVEALIRWDQPEKGFISPLEFISIAEDTGMIIPIGRWVIREACSQMKKWHEQGKYIRMAVNISPNQIFQDDLTEVLKKIAFDLNINTRYLELEITENIFVNNKYAIEKINELKELGVTIAIDDFGTGYSSLGYLKKLPINVIKIDKQFIDGILHDMDDFSIIKGIINIVSALDLKVIAEGVEVEKQIELLKYLKCDMVQGYFIDKPLPSNMIEQRYLSKKKMA